MAVRRLTASSIENNVWYKSMLAGNAAFIPATPFDLLETALVSSATAQVTFTNLSSYAAYTHLQIRYTARGVNGGTFPELQMRMNNDTTAANYSAHRMRGFGSGTGSNATTGVAYMRIGNATNTSTAEAFQVGIIDILNFGSTDVKKTIRAFTGVTANGYDDVAIQSGFWNSTSAITELDIFAGSGDVASGSRFSLYGRKG